MIGRIMALQRCSRPCDVAINQFGGMPAASRSLKGQEIDS